MSFRKKLFWWIVALILVAVVLGGLWKLGVIESLKWVNTLCMVCVAVCLVLFILMIACSRKNPHPEDIMGRAHSIEMKKRNSK